MPTTIRPLDDLADQRGEINERTPIGMSMVLSLIGLVAAVLWGWGSLANRITELESHQTDRDRRLERIEYKVDRLLGNQN